MNLTEFKQSLSSPQPPSQLSPALRALWYDGLGDWDRAHDLAQDDEGGDGDWVHAYLHRKEGDRWNAGYWYRRAGQPFPEVSLTQEWEEMVGELLRRTFGL
ncbi:MAG: hypothetical protein AAFQ87_24900 [Bacteroidota bacterium]